MSAFHFGDVTFWRDYRKFRTYCLIYAVVGRSTFRCSNRISATSRAVVNWSCLARRDRIRGDNASMSIASSLGDVTKSDWDQFQKAGQQPLARNDLKASMGFTVCSFHHVPANFRRA